MIFINNNCWVIFEIKKTAFFLYYSSSSFTDNDKILKAISTIIFYFSSHFNLINFIAFF